MANLGIRIIFGFEEHQFNIAVDSLKCGKVNAPVFTRKFYLRIDHISVTHSDLMHSYFFLTLIAV